MSARSTKGFSADGLRDMLGLDPRNPDLVWCVLGRVELHAGETSVWEENPDGDIDISVVTHSQAVPIRALLGGQQGPIWKVPKAGAEVLIHFPDGDYQGTPVAFVIRDGAVPAELTDDVTIVITAGPSTKIYAKAAGATARVMTTVDGDAIVNYVNKQFDPTTGHTHASLGAPPTESVGPGEGGSCPTPVGSPVLEAEHA